MSGSTGKIDDRGRAVRLASLGAIARQARGDADGGGSWGERAREFVRRCREVQKNTQSRQPWGCVVLPVALVGMRFATGVLGAPAWVGYVVLIVVMVTMSEYLRRRAGESPLQRIATGLALRVCPACGYDLAGLPVETDARVVCPECRAAWSAGRLGVRVTDGREGEAQVPLAVERAHETAGAPGESAGTPWELLALRPRAVFGLDAQGRIVRLADPRLDGVAERIEREEAAARLERAMEEGKELNGQALSTVGRAMLGKRSAQERVERVRRLVLPTDGEVLLKRIGWGVIGLVVLVGVVGFPIVAGSASRASAVAGGNTPAGRAGEVVVWFLVVTGGLAWVFVVVRGMVLAPRRFEPSVHISAMTMYRLCPGCTADLSRAERADGLLECPGCGAVWGREKGR